MKVLDVFVLLLLLADGPHQFPRLLQPQLARQLGLGSHWLLPVLPLEVDVGIPAEERLSGLLQLVQDCLGLLRVEAGHGLHAPFSAFGFAHCLTTMIIL
jgi:hypothetical protein